MTFPELGEALQAKGWRYDAANERFTDGKRRVEYRKILSLVPNMTIDALADYVNRKHEEWLANRHIQS